MQELNKTTANRPELPIKILQFGTGNFLRAFFDWMIEKSNEAGLTNHGIAIVQSTSRNNEAQKLYEKQDYMFHVYLEGIKDKKPIKEVTLVKNVMTLVNAAKEYQKCQELFLSEELEIIVSNTTEAGIRYEEGDDIFAEPPASFPAKITALLYQRFQKFAGASDKGLLIVCTELIENNGSTLKEYVLKHAAHFKLEQAFVDWVNTSCSFYDTLVDRIVPGFPKENIAEVQAEIGFNDNLVVKGEFFHVWAIGGDDKIKSKLPLDKVPGLNVQFMDDITEFRAKKVRVLNGAHTAMVPVSLQLGCVTVMDAFNTPEVETFINRMVDTEVLPVIDGDRTELSSFAASIVERFYNPFLKHYLKDISLNSLAKWEARDYPTVLDNYEKLGKKAHLAIFSFAALMVLYSGQSEVEFTPTDTPEFVEFIQTTFCRADIKGWIEGIVSHPTMWNVNMKAIPFFADEVAKGVDLILRNGMREALQQVIK
ncbi:tagaturonate reductase [Dysgonomonas massiliensis]|uniref:tagaturonate reductase n=1 Tax=Dysgonomonas massiliensis TaxID=2040292 RepID=UPI000C7769CE|nr:tagaturonate reductase [Dysgonomonas massiliensis]